MRLYKTTAFLGALMAAFPALADCVNPVGDAGHIRFDASASRVMVCDDTNWMPVKGGNICCGWTNTSGTGWVNYAGEVNSTVSMTVDTSGCGFTATPLYYTSLVGTGSHFGLIGINSIYNAAAASFTVHVGARDGHAFTLNAGTANANGYYVSWCAVGDKTGASSTGQRN